MSNKEYLLILTKIIITIFNFTMLTLAGGYIDNHYNITPTQSKFLALVFVGILITNSVLIFKKK